MKHRINNQLANNILQLQNLIKRDPESYKDEFYEQYENYELSMRIFKDSPDKYLKNLDELVMFIAQVSAFYIEKAESFPQELISVLSKHHSVLDPTMRMTFCRALILIRNKGLLTPSDLLSLFFKLLRCPDKILRKYLQVHIITDIKNINAKHKNYKVNSGLQSFMYQMLSDSNSIAAKVSLDIMIELYRKNIWKDSKTVNVIATACFSKTMKILVAAHEFFLGSDEVDENDSSDSEDDRKTVREVVSANKVNKQSRKRMKCMKRTQKVLKKSNRSKKPLTFDFSAVHLLHDPQGMAERLLKNVARGDIERYEIRLIRLNLVSRLVGVHRLILENLYSHLQILLKPHQKEVTKILLFAAQATHENVPPDFIEPVCRVIANNFITEQNSSEVITVGLNAIREICVRCPQAINQDLLQDLVEYKSYKNKNVVMAARSLIQLYRIINPKLLLRRDRGKPTEATKELRPLMFGELDAKDYIPGAEALSEEPPSDIKESTSHDDKEDSDDGSWIDLSHSEGEVLELGENFNSEDEDNSADEEDDCASDSEDLANKEVNSLLDVSDVASAEVNATSDDLKLNKSQTQTSKKSSTSKSSDLMKEKVQKATAVSQSRILTQEEFKKLKIIQISKQVQGFRGKKRKSDDLNCEDFDLGNRGEIVSLGDIEKLHKKPREDKESRLATILEGREGREKYGKGKQRINPFASKSHKEHRKNKAFMMIKHKVKRKIKRTFQQKQISLRDALLKNKKMK